MSMPDQRADRRVEGLQRKIWALSNQMMKLK
jgi:hypothetical protein